MCLFFFPPFSFLFCLVVEFSVRAAGENRFRKRTIVVSESRDGMRLLKGLREKDSWSRTRVAMVRKCDNVAHSNRCVIVVSNGQNHFRAEKEADAASFFSLMCAWVTQNTEQVKRETSGACDDLAAVLGGGGGLLDSPAVENGEVAGGKVDLSQLFKAKAPVLLIPGLASSALDVEASLDSAFKGKRMWISLGSLAAGKFGSGDKKDTTAPKKQQSPRKFAPRRGAKTKAASAGEKNGADNGHGVPRENALSRGHGECGGGAATVLLPFVGAGNGRLHPTHQTITFPQG